MILYRGFEIEVKEDSEARGWWIAWFCHSGAYISEASGRFEDEALEAAKEQIDWMIQKPR